MPQKNEGEIPLDYIICSWSPLKFDDSLMTTDFWGTFWKYRNDAASFIHSTCILENFQKSGKRRWREGKDDQKWAKKVSGLLSPAMGVQSRHIYNILYTVYILYIVYSFIYLYPEPSLIHPSYKSLWSLTDDPSQVFNRTVSGSQPTPFSSQFPAPLPEASFVPALLAALSC